MRHVYMTASSDIWRTDGMSKEGECLDCEFRWRLRECASTEQPAFIDRRDSDYLDASCLHDSILGHLAHRRNEQGRRMPGLRIPVAVAGVRQHRATGFHR